MTDYIENIQLPDGTILKINTVPTAGTTGQVLRKKSDEDNDLEWASIDSNNDLVSRIESLENKTNSVYTYKGSLESIDVLPVEASIGDVYNIESNGANYAWNGTEWDKLSETIDISNLATKEEIENKQDSLIAGDNITITDNVISASANDYDNLSITKNEQDKLQASAVLTSNGILKFDWIGTLAEYEAGVADGTIGEYTVCFVTDD